MNAYTQKNILSKSVAALIITVLVLTGCGGGGGGGSGSNNSEGEAAFLRGFDAGFAVDSEYFLGYDDSFYTVGAGPILYSGDLIPFSDELTYQAGFWDGQFEAYNDGYFVAYRFAFIIGFSEGYDNAYASDYLLFLANDLHIEYLHGGFSDGYNDGFSEGRIFGAFDYEVLLPFDWLDAFLDWEFGTDLYFEEVGKGTGEFGPVILYEWGYNPNTIGDLTRSESTTLDSTRRMRNGKSSNSLTTKTDGNTLDAVREFSAEQEAALDVSPETTARTTRDLTLTSTWLERLNSYLDSPGLTRSQHVDRSKIVRK